MGIGTGIKRAGFIRASDLEYTLEQVADVVAERFSQIEKEVSELRAEAKRLRNELETERRSRLAMSRKGR